MVKKMGVRSQRDRQFIKNTHKKGVFGKSPKGKGGEGDLFKPDNPEGTTKQKKKGKWGFQEKKR